MSLHSRSVTPMVEGGILSAVAIIFAFVSAYLPVLGALINFIWPVPIILLGVRHGYRYSIMATIVAGVLISLLMHPMQAVNVVIGFGLIGIALGHSLRKGHSPVKTILIGGVASLISKIAVLAITAAVMGFNPLSMEMESFQTAIGQTLDLYRSMGYSEEDLAKTAQTLTTILDIVKVVFPAGLVLASFCDTFFNYWLAKKVLKRLGYTYPGLPPFAKWCLPRWVVVVFVAGIAMIFFGKSDNNDLIYKIGMNIQVAGSVLLLVQGLGLFYCLAGKYNLSRFVRGIILILILTNGLFTQIVVIVGAFDVVVDYRRLRSPELK